MLTISGFATSRSETLSGAPSSTAGSSIVTLGEGLATSLSLVTSLEDSCSSMVWEENLYSEQIATYY